jgi:hypothetical protein
MLLGVNRLACSRSLSREPSLPTRIELLRRRQTAWKYLQWKEKLIVDTPQGFSPMYEYLGGVYSHGSLHTLSFFSLQTRLAEEKGISWIHSIPFPVIDYTSDPTEDVLIIITASSPGYYHRSLSHAIMRFIHLQD